jgi:adenosylcobinamide-GDP ribazoletransferase
MIRVLKDVAAAFQFLTRLPLKRLSYEPDALSRSAKFFPVVGLAVGIVGVIVYRWLAAHLPTLLAALFVVTFFALATGGLHEDGLADVADAFGGGWNREQILTILKDSRIGSFGALAIVLSVAMRFVLLANLPPSSFTGYVIAAQVLCRWTALPLGYALSAAQGPSSQAARIARQISPLSLAIGTSIAVVIVGYMLRAAMWRPIVSAIIVTVISGIYYWRRIGGVTGDCFGATNQVTEIAVYLCGVWHG